MQLQVTRIIVGKEPTETPLLFLIYEPGKKLPGAEARAMVAYLVQEEKHLSLTELGDLIDRDLVALSRAVGRTRERIRENIELADKILLPRETLLGISNCQA